MRNKALLASASIALSLTILGPLALSAASFRAGDNTTLQASETHTGDLYMAGASVTSAGLVTGDLVVAGGNVIISGKVGGDLAAGAGTVNVLADVADDARLGGGSITINAAIGGDLVLGGGQVNVGGAGVAGDLVMAGGNISINAPIGGYVKMAGGNIYINSTIASDINITADKLTLGPNAVISGNLNYKALEAFTQEEGAQVLGVVNYEPISRSAGDLPKAAAGLISFMVIAKFLSLLICALILGHFFRRYCLELMQKAVERPLLELGRGVLVLIVLPVVSVLLLVTVIGVPFGILGLVSLVALAIFVWILAPILIGSVVWRYFDKGELAISWKSTLLGVLIFNFLHIIPVIGWLISTLIMLVTLGAAIAMKWQLMRQWR